MRGIAVWGVGWLLAVGSLGQGAEPLSPAETAAKLLDASIQNKAGFEKVRVTGARVHPTQKGTLILYGTLPDGKLRDKVGKEASQILDETKGKPENPGGYSEADVSRMVDRLSSRDEQLAFVVQKGLADAAERATVVSVSDAKTEPDGALRLNGWVGTEKARAAVERQAARALAQAIGRKDIDGPVPRVVATKLRRAPDEVFLRIQSSLDNRAEVFKGVRLLYGEPVPSRGQAYAVYGLAPDEATRTALVKELQALVVEATKDQPTPVKVADTRGVLIGAGPADESRVFEAATPDHLYHYVRVLTFDPVAGHLRLLGYTEQAGLEARFERFVNVTHVDTGSVVVGPPAPDLSRLPATAELLGRGDGRRLVDGGTMWVQAGRGTHQTARDGWLLRAAGHVYLGQWDLAGGEVRLVLGIEQQLPCENRAIFLGPLQGISRAILDRFFNLSEELVLPGRPQQIAEGIVAGAKRTYESAMGVPVLPVATTWTIWVLWPLSLCP